MDGAAANEPFYDRMLKYLDRLDGTRKFVDAFGAVDATSPVPPPIEDPPFDFMVSTDWRGLASAASRPLVGAVHDAMSELPWHVPYGGGAAAAGPGFREKSMSTGRIGPNAPVRAEALASGFFVVGPNVTYFDHQHEPEELYLPIAGQAEFWNESRGWYTAGPDDVTVHPQWEWHAMKTGDAPVLIFWAWLGPEGFDVPPALRPTMAGLPA